jgi:hypothetical protein
MFSKLLPDEQLESVFELDLEGLWARGVRGIIFDLDNTLGAWGFERMDEQTIKWLAAIQERGFKIGFLSNHQGKGRERLFEHLSHPVVFSAKKPRRGGFRQILRELGLAPHEAAMVGDQLFTDVWGAKRLGLYTILVKPVALDDEGPITRLRRWLERRIIHLGGQRT